MLAELTDLVRERMNHGPAHDFEHVMRVYKNAQAIARAEQADERLVLYAVLLHDIVSYPKTDERSRLSSAHSAAEARKILHGFGLPDSDIDIVAQAIEDHSFSQNRRPETAVGRILQDADRLDALGAIGIARVFAVSGAENRPFYSGSDPFCADRSPDDKKWTIDHFFAKLLKLEKLMNTESGRAHARARTRIITEYLEALKGEI